MRTNSNPMRTNSNPMRLFNDRPSVTLLPLLPPYHSPWLPHQVNTQSLPLFDFLSGFLLGIIFTVGALVFGVYKLLLRLEQEPRPPHSYSPPHIHYSSFRTHDNDDMVYFFLEFF